MALSQRRPRRRCRAASCPGALRNPAAIATAIAAKATPAPTDVLDVPGLTEAVAGLQPHRGCPLGGRLLLPAIGLNARYPEDSPVQAQVNSFRADPEHAAAHARAPFIR